MVICGDLGYIPLEIGTLRTKITSWKSLVAVGNSVQYFIPASILFAGIFVVVYF